MSDKLKFINKLKQNKPAEQPKKYIPQYKILGVQPQDGSKMTQQHLSSAVVDINNPKPVIKQSIPNIGNNTSWSSVNEEIVDDINLDPNHPMVDNNDYVDPKYMGITNNMPSLMSSNNSSNDDLLKTVLELDEGAYLLIVSGVSVCSGPKLEIQELAYQLVMGEHELSDGNSVDMNDIIIMRKIPIKMGLFLE